MNTDILVKISNIINLLPSTNKLIFLTNSFQLKEKELKKCYSFTSFLTESALPFSSIFLFVGTIVTFRIFINH